jgi:CBS domain-containing protein
MNAKDVMSAPVITVGPEALVRDVAALLVRNDISGVPVVAQGRVVGIVSEGDLLHRVEIGTDRGEARAPWWRRWIAADSAPEYVKTHAKRAKDIMTRDVIAVDETTPLARIASVFEQRRIRRVPVVRDGRLVGIVTPADLVAALARESRSAEAPRPQSDETIRAQLIAELRRQPWWDPAWSTVWVTAGVVYYCGLVEREDDRRAARVAAEGIPGVRAVVDERVPFSNWQPML